MIKKLLIFVVSLIAFPTITRTALIQTELTYNVRNAKGIYPFVSYLGGTGQVNLANGNLIFSRNLITRPGRAGFSADLSLVYNSKIWDRVGSVMIIPEAGSWAGLGWRIGLPKLVQGSSSYAIILSDGSSHEIVDFGSGVWKSVDSTYIRFDPATRMATLKGGVKLIFGNVVGTTFYMTEMKDRNGNQVKATYLPGTGKLNQVQDGLGPLANFYYSADGMLQRLQSFGKVRMSYSFSYTPFSPSTSFSLPAQLSQGEKLLSQIKIDTMPNELQQNFACLSG